MTNTRPHSADLRQPLRRLPQLLQRSLPAQPAELFGPGARRHKLNVYDRSRLKSVAPSRLDIDGRSVSDWRAKGFFDVVGGTEPARTLLMQLLSSGPGIRPCSRKNRSTRAISALPTASSARVAQSTPELGMPYGLPPLSQTEMETLNDWIARGAPGPSDASLASRHDVPSQLQTQVRAWEAFLNGRTPREKLVARYLYEHLFLAHLYFTSETASRRPAFFRLVRSRTLCEAGVDEIATRRPNDDPGPGDFHYCLSRLDGTIVDKTHIPYDLSPQKLERIRRTFLEPQWDVKNLPGYSEETASNPFATFADIPVRARYQFLLDDAEYEISTFIKGPVCNGSVAVNSIQEQFFVLFLRPDADSMVMSAEHARQAQDMLILPGVWGSDVPILDSIPFLRRLIAHREAYRKLRADDARKLRPAGYTLEDIWNGDGRNPNALLTVFRHFDTAVVTQGAVGDLPKTLFVLDYPLLERLVYNLVVNYDVFGNVGHQSLTRLYMDMIRMEAEELFLAFLPPSQRAWPTQVMVSRRPAHRPQAPLRVPARQQLGADRCYLPQRGQRQSGAGRAGDERVSAPASARPARCAQLERIAVATGRGGDTRAHRARAGAAPDCFNQGRQRYAVRALPSRSRRRAGARRGRPRAAL